jgi:transposase
MDDVSADSYEKMLLLLRMCARADDVLQDDNAGPHRDSSLFCTRRLFNRWVTWPPRSPELNAIEYVWSDMEAHLDRAAFLADSKETWKRLLTGLFFSVSARRVQGHVVTCMSNAAKVYKMGGANHFVEVPFKHPYKNS